MDDKNSQDYNNLNNQLIPYEFENEVEFDSLIKLFSRNKKIILSITLITLLGSTVYAYSKKKVWEGRIQIVLSKQEKVDRTASFLEGNPLADIVGVNIGTKKNQLKTEVGILKSPSILLPIYNFAIKEKEKDGDNIKRFRYRAWRKKNLTVELQKGTSILDLSYRDTKKDLIIPVLTKISESYQTYSDRDRKKGIEQGLSYLKTQISLYKEKSLSSIREAQRYAIEENLTSLKSIENNDVDILNALDIEKIRVQASNEIREIEALEYKLKEIENTSNLFLYLFNDIKEFSELLKDIKRLDEKISHHKSVFTENDTSLKLLKNQRKIMIDMISQDVKSYLQAKKLLANARLTSSERPKGVIIKYKRLYRQAVNDQKTLLRLEKENTILGLEQAKIQDPWELITTPTLLERKVAPSRSKIMGIGLLIGIVFGYITAIFLEKRKDLIFSENQIKSLLNSKYLFDLSLNIDFEEIVSLIVNSNISESVENKVAIIPIGDVEIEKINSIKNHIETNYPDKSIIFTKDLIKAKKYKLQFVITQLGRLTYSEAMSFKQKFILQGKNIDAILIVNSNEE